MDFPTVLSTSDIRAFKKYLREAGNLEELPPYSDYEIFRFRYVDGVLILYRNKDGTAMKANSDALIQCWQAYKTQHNGVGFPFRRRPATRGRKDKKALHKALLMKRDGNSCFYCGLPMHPTDQTQEHILSICHGGSNRLENKALAHSACNEQADKLDVVQKVKLRDRMRAKNES